MASCTAECFSKRRTIKITTKRVLRLVSPRNIEGSTALQGAASLFRCTLPDGAATRVSMNVEIKGLEVECYPAE
jgi:hypothetical protein